jgi:hypothetical protein
MPGMLGLWAPLLGGGEEDITMDAPRRLDSSYEGSVSREVARQTRQRPV